MALSFTVSYTFSPSTTISSSQVNQNTTDVSNVFTGLEAKTKTFSNLGIDTQLKSAGTIESADGLVGTPGITFSGDLDNGLYRIGSNNPALSAGGTKVIDMKATGVAVLGTTTNDSGAALFVGEYIDSVVGSVSYPATTVYGDATSISLTAGDWNVWAQVHTDQNGATWTTMQTGISVTSGNSATGLVTGDSLIQGSWASSSTTPVAPAQFVMIRLSLASTTTVYLKFRAIYSAGGPPATLGAKLAARRTR